MKRDKFSTSFLSSAMVGFVKQPASCEQVEAIDPTTEHANIICTGKVLDQNTFEPLPEDQIPLTIVSRTGVGPTTDP